MKTLATRVLVLSLLAAMAWLLLVAAGAPAAAPKQPDKLVILSTSDVKGKTSPCG
jgi:spermidine/putrescine-binding protein